jgi:hypothetical protein
LATSCEVINHCFSGEHVDGAVFPDGFCLNTFYPEANDFIDIFYTNYGREPDVVAALVYDAARMIIKVVEEYALEDSIVKVFGSETMSLAVDHGVQIHGGYGYIKEYPIERSYRDARINRLFEGTNEINRLIIPATIMRKAMRGQLPVMEIMGEVKDGLTDKGKRPALGKGPLAVEAYTTEMAKRACLYSTGQAIQKYGQGLDKEQEALMAIADMVIDLLGMDSVVGRANKIVGKKGAEAAKIPVEIARALAAKPKLALLDEPWRDSIQRKPRKWHP